MAEGLLQSKELCLFLGFKDGKTTAFFSADENKPAKQNQLMEEGRKPLDQCPWVAKRRYDIVVDIFQSFCLFLGLFLSRKWQNKHALSYACIPAGTLLWFLLIIGKITLDNLFTLEFSIHLCNHSFLWGCWMN